MDQSAPQITLVKPYPDFPLTPHVHGYWVKKIRGVQHRIGDRYATAEEALEAWDEVKDALMLGQKPARAVLTTRQAMNLVLTKKEQAVENKELSQRHFADLKCESKFILAHIPGERPINKVSAADFTKMRKTMRENNLTLKSQHSKITKIQVVFNSLVKLKELDSVDYGDDFAKPGSRSLKIEKEERLSDHEVLTPANLLILLKAAPTQLKAMILLGINCAYNNTDCAVLRWTDIKADGWLRRARNKTGIARSAKLWPETIEALNAVPKREGDKLVFRTKYGNPWVVVRGDVIDNALSKQFRKLAKRCGVKASFKDLRSLFQTIAEEVCFDMVAIRTVMGHTDKSMAAEYRRRVLDKRVFQVCKGVRNWLYGKQPTKVVETSAG